MSRLAQELWFKTSVDYSTLIGLFKKTLDLKFAVTVLIVRDANVTHVEHQNIMKKKGLSF